MEHSYLPSTFLTPRRNTLNFHEGLLPHTCLKEHVKNTAVAAKIDINESPISRKAGDGGEEDNVRETLIVCCSEPACSNTEARVFKIGYFESGPLGPLLRVQLQP